MKSRIIVMLMVCGLVGQGWARMPAGAYRTKLAKAAEIQSYFCAKGYAWFFADGRLEGCTVARDTDFGMARIPAGSGINLTSDGKPHSAFMKRDTTIGGYVCEGGNWLLGPSEGAITLFHPNGQLKLCWLAGDTTVQGVPCAHAGMFTGNSGVEFYDSGKLKACKLAKDYGGRKRGDRFGLSQ